MVNKRAKLFYEMQIIELQSVEKVSHKGEVGGGGGGSGDVKN